MERYPTTRYNSDDDDDDDDDQPGFEPESESEEEDLTAAILAQSGYLGSGTEDEDEGGSRGRCLLLPPPAVPAFKGSSGKTAAGLAVSWAPDVYDPPPSAGTIAPKRKGQRAGRGKEKEKERERKERAQKQERAQKAGKDRKKQAGKRGGRSARGSRAFADDDD